MLSNRSVLKGFIGRYRFPEPALPKLTTRGHLNMLNILFTLFTNYIHLENT